MEERFEERALEGVFECDGEAGFDPRSVSNLGGWGDREGRELRDISEGDLEEGKDERDVLPLIPLPFELVVPFVDGRYIGWDI
jgi:hypothetical protein